MKSKNPHEARKITDYSPLTQHKWSFLTKASLAIPDKACENQYVMQSIHEMEEKSMDERILDQYEVNLVEMIKAKSTVGIDGKPVVEESMMSFDDIKELSISLNIVRGFTKEKHLKDSKKSPTILPHLEHKSATHELNLNELEPNSEEPEEEEVEHLGVELSELDKVLLNHRFRTPKRMTEIRGSFDSNPTYVDQANHDEKIAKALIKSRAKISRQLAENIKAQIGEVQEQIVKTTIARKFRAFTADNGYRLPTCLEHLPAIPVEKPGYGGGGGSSSKTNQNSSSNYMSAMRRNSEFTVSSSQKSSSNGSNMKPIAPPIAEKSSRIANPRGKEQKKTAKQQ